MSTPHPSCGKSCYVRKLGLALRRRRPRPGSRPTPSRSRSSRGSTRSSTRCCATARWRSCARPTASRLLAEVQVRRAHPRHVQSDGGPHRPHLSSDASPTCTTSLSAPKSGPSGFRSAFVPAEGLHRSWWPTTTRSSCAASPTWPRTRAWSTAFDLRHRHPHGTTASRVYGVARRTEVSHWAAVQGQDGLLRPGLRHGGLRSQPASRPWRSRRRPGHHGEPISAAFPAREAPTWTPRCGRRQDRAAPHRDPVRPHPAA